MGSSGFILFDGYRSFSIQGTSFPRRPDSDDAVTPDARLHGHDKSNSPMPVLFTFPKEFFRR